jgi:uncharacterized Zn finger protein
MFIEFSYCPNCMANTPTEVIEMDRGEFSTICQRCGKAIPEDEPSEMDAWDGDDSQAD